MPVVESGRGTCGTSWENRAAARWLVKPSSLLHGRRSLFFRSRKQRVGDFTIKMSVSTGRVRERVKNGESRRPEFDGKPTESPYLLERQSPSGFKELLGVVLLPGSGLQGCQYCELVHGNSSCLVWSRRTRGSYRIAIRELAGGRGVTFRAHTALIQHPAFGARDRHVHSGPNSNHRS